MGCLVCRWSHTLPVIIVNDPIEFVTSFIYLVSKVSKTSDLITEINRCGLVADFLRGLLARPSPLTFMTSSLMSSGPLGTLVQSHEQWRVLPENPPPKHPLHCICWSCPATTWWPPYQSHLPVQHTICWLETTSWQGTQLLERCCLSGPPADQSGIGGCSNTLPRPCKSEQQGGSHRLKAFMEWDLSR